MAVAVETMAGEGEAWGMEVRNTVGVAGAWVGGRVGELVAWRVADALGRLTVPVGVSCIRPHEVNSRLNMAMSSQRLDAAGRLRGW